MVKVIVREHNQYGQYGAGAILEVEETELARVPWCLQRLDELEQQKAEATQSTADATQAQRAAFERGRQSFIDARLQAEQRQKERELGIAREIAAELKK